MKMQVVTLPTTINYGHFDHSLYKNKKRNLFLSQHFAGTRNKLVQRVNLYLYFLRLQKSSLITSIAHDTDVLSAVWEARCRHPTNLPWNLNIPHLYYKKDKFWIFVSNISIKHRICQHISYASGTMKCIYYIEDLSVFTCWNKLMRFLQHNILTNHRFENVSYLWIDCIRK